MSPFCSHLMYLNLLLICTRHLHRHCLIYSLLLCTLSASSSSCLSAQFPFILMPSSSCLFFLVSTSFELSLCFPFLSPLFLLYIMSSVSLILLLTTSANSYHLLWCNTLLQYLSPLSTFLISILAVVCLLWREIRRVPTTLRLTGVKGFGTGSSYREFSMSFKSFS